MDVLGVPVVPFESYDHAVGCIDRAVQEGRRSFWVAVNPQKIHRAWHEPQLLEVLRNADAGICDGSGVSLAARVLRGHSLFRCTGCDLFFRLIAKAAQRGWGVFLLGASPESNARACENLERSYPGLCIAGRRDGYFRDSAAVIEQINRSGADLLFVAMGSPRQEYWLWEHRDALVPPFRMGVGGSIDVASGTIPRAPKFFRKTGTEFVFQLMTEPGKRLRRQIVYVPYVIEMLRRRVSRSAEV